MNYTDHQEYLLSAVKLLKEHGAAWVYLLSFNYEFSQCDKNIYGSSGPGSNKSSDYSQSDDTYSEQSNGNGRLVAHTKNQLMHNMFY